MAAPSTTTVPVSAELTVTPTPLPGVTYSPQLLVILTVLGAILSQIVAFGILTTGEAQEYIAIGGPLVALGVLIYDVAVRHVHAKTALAMAGRPLRELEPLVAHEAGQIGGPSAEKEAELVERVATQAIAQVREAFANPRPAGVAPSPLVRDPGAV